VNDSKKSDIGEHSRNMREGGPRAARGSNVEPREEEPRAGNNFNPGSIYDVQRKWQKRRAEVRLAVSHEPGEPPRLEIDFVGIPKASRCKGYGSKLMKEVIRAADSKKMDIALTPEGSAKSERGKKFFERLGFKEAAGEDGPLTWMVRKVFRREYPKDLQSQAPKRLEKPEPTSLFMANAKKFKEGNKSAIADYGGSGKISHGASGSKSSYGYLAGEQEHEKRPPRPADVPAGHMASWNEEKKEYEIVPKKRTYGGVVFNDKGEVLLGMDTTDFNDYSWTFPMGPAHEDETPEETARREVEEKTGVRAEILSQVPESFEDELTIAFFYIMETISAGDPVKAGMSQIAWVKPAEAKAYLSQTTSEMGRKRDTSLLDAALRYTKEAFEEKVRDSFARFVKNLPAQGTLEENPARDSRSAGDEEVYPSEVENRRAGDEMDNGNCISATETQNALIYWGRKEHRARYSAREQREIMARLLRAAQAHGLDPES
jgi:8-oxo-dGTP pyrophosphatase MutT (NUDIX family)/GNAT superfamily N-acetyltransferase